MTYVYVSAAADGTIDGYAMEPATGELAPISRTSVGTLVMPMTPSPDRRHLYAVVRSPPHRVVTFAIDARDGSLAQQAVAPLPDSMAYVSTDAAGRFLFSASYGGHAIAVSPIDPYGLVTAAAIQVVPIGRNAHSIRADRSNRFVYAASLGADQVLQFRFDAASGALTPNDPPLVRTRAGSGPRHLALSPDNGSLYVLNELAGTVTHFAIDEHDGTLAELDTADAIPSGSGLLQGFVREPGASATADDPRPRIWAADLGLTPDGRFLYASERTGSTVALLAIEAGSGRPRYVTSYPTEQQPRGIRIDPTGTFLVVAGERSDRLSVFRIDARDGGLALLGRYPVGRGANWVEIVAAR